MYCGYHNNKGGFPEKQCFAGASSCRLHLQMYEFHEVNKWNGKENKRGWHLYLTYTTKPKSSNHITKLHDYQWNTLPARVGRRFRSLTSTCLSNLQSNALIAEISGNLSGRISARSICGVGSEFLTWVFTLRNFVTSKFWTSDRHSKLSVLMTKNKRKNNLGWCISKKTLHDTLHRRRKSLTTSHRTKPEKMFEKSVTHRWMHG